MFGPESNKNKRLGTGAFTLMVTYGNQLMYLNVILRNLSPDQNNATDASNHPPEVWLS
jgi:hypothetical protein